MVLDRPAQPDLPDAAPHGGAGPDHLHRRDGGERQEKRVYSITDAGRDAVRQWAAEPVRYPPNRDAQRLKLIFGDQGDVADLRRHLHDHRRHFQRRKEQLESFHDELVARRHPRIEGRIAAASEPSRQELVLRLRDFAYRGDITRAETEIAWADEVLRWLDRFDGDDGADEQSAPLG